MAKPLLAVTAGCREVAHARRLEDTVWQQDGLPVVPALWTVCTTRLPAAFCTCGQYLLLLVEAEACGVSSSSS